MNIIEAIKSGKGFKRKTWPRYEWGDVDYFHKEDILAVDWEIEEKKTQVSQKIILEAWADAIKCDGTPLPSGTPRLSLFLHKLGF